MAIGSRAVAYDEASVNDAPTLAPGIPADYYQRILENEERHWWYRGMLSITAALLGERLTRPGQRLLDAGCGTGGFLRWALDRGSFASAAGVDIGSAAIELAAATAAGRPAHGAAPVAPFRRSLLRPRRLERCPPARSRAGARESLGELRRVLATGRDAAAAHERRASLRRERDDWRVYDRGALPAPSSRLRDSRASGVTYANYAPVALRRRCAGARRTHRRRARTGFRAAEPSRFGRRRPAALLAAEARWLRRSGGICRTGTRFSPSPTPA